MKESITAIVCSMIIGGSLFGGLYFVGQALY